MDRIASKPARPDGRGSDGSAGDADYGVIADAFSRFRRPDPGIAAVIRAALGDARSLLNVGAGTGSYEPVDLSVTAIEPSRAMRERRVQGASPAIDAVAEALPFPDASFDASMAIFSIHQWRNLAQGLAEMRRVTVGPVVLVTCDPTCLAKYWLNDYAPEVIAVEASRYPQIGTILAALGGAAAVHEVPIPLLCTDGFAEAYYGRPERLLDPAVRLACSAWSFVDDAVVRRFEAHLSRDLADGVWDQRYGSLRSQPHFPGSLRLIVVRTEVPLSGKAWRKPLGPGKGLRRCAPVDRYPTRAARIDRGTRCKLFELAATVSKRFFLE